MKQISENEMKQLQIEMLQKIHDFCQTNNIDYFLAFGSLIGAVRHNGYIPWDDDIDIVMPRHDYEKFVKSFNGTYKDLECISPEIDWDYYAPYANVYDNRTLLIEEYINHGKNPIGVKIDVFPLDGVPSDSNEYKKYTKDISRIKQAITAKNVRLGYYLKNSKRALLKFLKIRFLNCFYSRKYLQKKMSILVKQYPYNESEYVDDVVFNAYENARVERKAFEGFILHKFENYEFRSNFLYRCIYVHFLVKLITNL